MNFGLDKKMGQRESQQREGQRQKNNLRTISKMRRDEAGNVGQRIQFHISTRLGVSQFSVLVSPSDWKSWSVTRKTTTSTIARNSISFFFSIIIKNFSLVLSCFNAILLFHALANSNLWPDDRATNGLYGHPLGFDPGRRITICGWR